MKNEKDIKKMTEQEKIEEATRLLESVYDNELSDYYIYEAAMNALPEDERISWEEYKKVLYEENKNV